MEFGMRARYMCIEAHDDFIEGAVYTFVGASGYDWGHYYSHYEHEGKPVDISKFDLVHSNISQEQ